MEITVRNLARLLWDWGSICFLRRRDIECVCAISPWHAGTQEANVLYLVGPQAFNQFKESALSGNYLLYDIPMPDAQDVYHSGERANIMLVPACTSEELLYKRTNMLLMSPNSTPASEILLNSLCHNQFQGILNVCARLLGNPVAVFDTSLELLGTSNPLLPSFENSAYVEHITRLLEDKALTKQICKETSPFIYSPQPETGRTIFAPVMINGTITAFFAVPEISTVFAQDDIYLVQQIVQALSLELQKDDIYRSKSNLIHEYFLVKLIENTAGNYEFIEKRMKNLALQTTDAMYIVSFRFLEIAFSPSPQQIRFISETLRELLRADLLTSYKNHFVALVIRNAPPMLSKEQKMALIRFLKSRQLVGGVSFRFSDLSKAHIYYRQSLDATGLGRLLYPEETLYRMRDLMIYEFFFRCNVSMELRDYILPEVYQLQAYDDAHQTDLCKTLNCFLHLGMNSAETAKALHIHRNTLHYRLDKIRDITGLNWSGDTLLYLLLSFRLLEYLEQTRRIPDFSLSQGAEDERTTRK